jgi:hypothetical protein
VQTLPIVPSFDVLEDGSASLRSRIKLMICTFSLECAEKAFHSSVVEAIANPAHTDQTVINSQTPLIQVAGVLAALIGVMQQLSRWVPLGDRHIPCILHQGGFHMLIHRPADHAARKQVQDYSQPSVVSM